MEEQKTLWEKIWYYVVLAFSLLFGLFWLERSKAKDAESQIVSDEEKKQDAILADRVDQSKLQLEEERKKVEAEKQKQMTAEELAEYFRKNK